jgi:hypothetical protein
MLRLLTLLMMLSVAGAAAQTTNAPTAAQEEALEADIVVRARETPLALPEDKPNQIQGGKASYSGIPIFVLKTRKPLQLINPAAPARYGEAEDNVVRDPVTRRVSGLKFFCIKF